jgi:hypothetical protein
MIVFLLGVEKYHVQLNLDVVLMFEQMTSS